MITPLQKKHKILALEQAKLTFMQENRAKLFFAKGYPWQHKVWKDGYYNKQRLLMAGNQVGKTSCTCCELAYHLMQDYPEGWEGYRFNHPINVWAMGADLKQLKRVLQKRLLGEYDGVEAKGGWIPQSRLVQDSIVRSGQPRNSILEINIRGETGISTLSFLSYSQDNQSYMGDIVDLILIDEEPKDAAVYPQVAMRTINGDRKRGGLVLLGFTPEYGTTELVEQFTNHLQANQSLTTATWEEAPHMSSERKAQMLAALPPHEREMRSKGIPQMGSGAIYPVPDESLYDDVLEIPGHWPKLCAIDFGWNFTALCWLAWDREADIIHLYDCLKIERQTPAEIALMIRARGEWIPIAYPHDGHLPERGSGIAQKELYVNHGVKMLPTHATDSQGSMSVEAGIMRLLQRMQAGTFKVAQHLNAWFEEKRLYRRETGKILKKNDHLLDACRYGEMMLRFARTQESATTRIVPRYNHKRGLR